MTDTHLLDPDPDGIAKAADILRAGGLVAFPTETVYGLGADATNDGAVARIFEAKARPSFNPLIVHVASEAAAQEIAHFGEVAKLLAFHFWPGPLTLVVPARSGAVSPLVSAGLDTVALRVPAHPVAQNILSAFGGGVAAPSANPSGRISPTRAAHVLDGLSGRIKAVIDGGACAVGVESTIVLADDTPPRLLRPGGIPAEAIEQVLGASLAHAADTQTPIAPGQLSSHYAPNAVVRLNATQAAEGELWLGFGPCPGATLNLSPSGDLVEAAANLFHMFRALDDTAAPGQIISVAPIPQQGLGLAINDRLARAAAPRG